MSKGYLGLGGRQYAPLFGSGNVVSTRTGWGLSDEHGTTVNIPTRSKTVVIYAESEHVSELVEQVRVLDSVSGSSYRSKLATLSQPCTLVNFDETMRASGIAVVNQEVSCIGLYDQQLDYSYFFWANEASEIEAILASDPLRYLIFRFPIMDTFFLSIPALTAKWRRWASVSQLLGFNALERRLTNG